MPVIRLIEEAPHGNPLRRPGIPIRTESKSIHGTPIGSHEAPAGLLLRQVWPVHIIEVHQGEPGSLIRLLNPCQGALQDLLSGPVEVLDDVEPPVGAQGRDKVGEHRLRVVHQGPGVGGAHFGIDAVVEDLEAVVHAGLRSQDTRAHETAGAIAALQERARHRRCALGVVEHAPNAGPVV